MIRLSLLGAWSVQLLGCLDTQVITCSWGLVCPEEMECNEGLQRCVDPAQRLACVDLSDGDRCHCPFCGSEYKCRKRVCEEPICGDGLLDTNEECDDGNFLDNDGCSKRCVEESFRWQELAITNRAQGPSARAGAALTFDPNAQQVILHGGEDSAKHTLSDTWVLELKQGGTPFGTWRELSLATRPSIRSSHAMAYDPVRDRALLFGGNLPSGTTQYATGTWELEGDTWRNAGSSEPPGRIGHTMVWDGRRQQVVLFGGYNGTYGGGHDTWVHDGSSWRQMNTPTVPQKRQNHMMAYDAGRGRVVVLGGFGPQMLEPRLSTWELAGDDWVALPAANLKSPRFRGACAYDMKSSRVIIFGGHDETQKLHQETWALHAGQLVLLETTEAKPLPRYDHGMVSLGALGVLVFGGTGANGDPLSDVWIGSFEESCGNGELEQGELCDGNLFIPSLSSRKCTDFNPAFSDGEILCTEDCRVDSRACR